MKTIILTGGGTAGHIMPNLALLPALSRYFDKIIYTGQANSMEESLAKANNLPFYNTQCAKLARGKILSNFAIPFDLIKGVKDAKTILSELKPSLVFSKGGFASLPTVLAAKSLKIPYVIHESDATLGLANKLVASSASVILTSYKNTKIKNSLYTGNPLRSQIFLGKRENILKDFKLDPDRKTLLFIGGSSGSLAINNCLELCLDELSSKFNILHICGKKHTPPRLFKHYHAVGFVDNIEDYYAASDVIISRCGAIASTEILALGKKAIFIPLPKDASRGDQIDNAKSYVEKNLCTLLYQEELTPKRLIGEINTTLSKTFASLDYDRNTPDNIADILWSKRKSVITD